ncbi:MAG: lasso peptide biosynthesis B2 protein [Proteobacteria bacterium]|nr:lasso peptide biosynthesis B2 protein [Pseudomonadota bacterium]
MALSRSIRHPLRRFAQVDGRRRALVVEAVLRLVVARLGLMFVSFPRLARRLGTLSPPQSSRTTAASRDAAIVCEIRWAVTRAACYLPFYAACLPQALAARHMLQRRGIANVLHFGVTGRAANGIEAHAWLDAGGFEVTGYPLATDCTELARFA